MPKPKSLISLPSLITGTTGRNQTLDTILQEFELESLPLIDMEQVHGDVCAILTKAKTQTLKGTDAVLTTLPNVVLVTRTADCLPVLIAHPSGLIGIAHCGRKSTDLGLLRKTLEIVKTKFGITDNLKLWFGPAICERCYQIDEATDLHYNLVRKNFQQVLEVFPDGKADVSPSNYCTFHQNEQFYSYRKEGADVPKNYSVISFRP